MPSPYPIITTSAAGFMQLVQASPANENVEKRLVYWQNNYAPAAHELFVALAGQKIVGMASTSYPGFDPKFLWLDFVSVDRDYGRQGISTDLLRAVFAERVKQRQPLRISAFSRPSSKVNPWDPDCKAPHYYTIPRLHHAEFPELLLRWQKDQPLIDGKRPYRLTSAYFGRDVVFD